MRQFRVIPGRFIGNPMAFMVLCPSGQGDGKKNQHTVRFYRKDLSYLKLSRCNIWLFLTFYDTVGFLKKLDKSLDLILRAHNQWYIVDHLDNIKYYPRVFEVILSLQWVYLRILWICRFYPV
jgi:hypothetical protein